MNVFDEVLDDRRLDVAEVVWDLWWSELRNDMERVCIVVNDALIMVGTLCDIILDCS